MIPKQAIIAAREAMREVTPPPGVSKAAWLDEYGSVALIAGAIAAAAPYLMAVAWDRCAASIVDQHGNPIIPDSNTNPYRSKA